MGKHIATQTMVARHGCVLRPRVKREVFTALFELGRKMNLSPDTTAAQVLGWWYDDLLAVNAGALRPEVKPEVRARIAEEAKRTGMTEDAVTAQVLQWWHEDCAVADMKKPPG